MAGSLDFGALLFPNVPWEVLEARCRQVEELGFCSLWVDDHLVNPRHPEQPWLESWTTLAGLAAGTERLRLGPLVSNIVLRHPVVLARQALTLEALSAGRLTVGIGAGYAATDHGGVGVPVWTARERAERLREAVELLDLLLAGEPTTFRGRHYAVENLQLRPEPVQRPRPPLCIAAHADSSLRLVAEHGDAWVSFGGFGLGSAELIDLTRRRSAALDRHCTEIGRNPSTVRRQVLAGSPATTPDPIWSSVDAFDTWAGRWQEIGIDEIVLYFPPEGLYATDQVDVRVLDHLRELLTATRAG